ncbi:PREDICTED: pentatricopeptide repeat-containing protein At5g02830, chloroplastic isoform X2 [Nelumbo nucifera]|uniref:Pentatricopeptide repeat-containing protein At5g02830, chloroplastic isoform X2 n=1 Tax=Nelumbo nucifera TaxID=4432 RepID=A0A1U8AD84_NELNU|nr:PREDICTED: pentatricopeptide repeat-containing protein At5g02830, chloroplastic isoform X2 [Nelumbo nucifera]
MKELVIIGSCMLLPPSPSPTPHHSTKQKHSSLSPTRLSPAKLSCSSVDSTAAPRPPLLTSVRQDLTPRHRNRLKYYADLASKLAEDGKLEDFLMIAETVLVSGTPHWQFVASLSVKLVSAGVSGFLRDGKRQTFIDFFYRVDKLGLRPSALIDGSGRKLLARECRRLADDGKLEDVVGLMEILSGFGFSIKEFVDPFRIVNMCVERCDPDMAIRYACIVPHAHVIFSYAIHEFGKKRDLMSALNVFDASKCNSNGPNMYTWRAMIDACGHCGDYLKSRYIYEELLTQKVTPNIYVFNSIMNVNAKDLSFTLHVYKQMQNLGVSADVTSYNILLKACCLAERVDLAQKIYIEMEHKASTGELKLDVFTYSTIIKAFADAKMWQMALKVKEDMLSSGVTPNMFTWSSLLSACANVGLVGKAIQVFEEMLQAGCEPNSQSCNILLHACVEAYQYDRAFRMFQLWKESGIQKIFQSKESSASTGNLVTEGAGENYNMPSDISDTEHLCIDKVVPFTPTTATYNILMKACGTDYCRAKDLMDEMKLAGLSPNHISWSILIDVRGRSGDVGGALQALKIMREAGPEPDVIAYTTAIKACVKNKNLKVAFSLFEEMKRYGLKPNLVTYNTLLRARRRYGSLHEVQQCLAIYQDMRKAGYSANDYFLKELIEEWCEGVIQDNNQDQSLLRLGSSCNKSGIEKPQSLLLEVVAAHLQKDIADNLVVDLRGLTKVEARIVILAVLRMMKERCTLGQHL